MKKAKKAKNEIKDSYRITAQILGRIFSATADSVAEALKKLDVGRVKGRCILSVERNGNKKDRILMPNQSFRLFSTLGLSKEVAVKNTSQLFEGI